MDTLLGILELVAWIVAIIAIAAAVTYAVIRLVPSKDDKAAASSGSEQS